MKEHFKEHRIVTLFSCCEGCLGPSSTAQYSVVFWVLIACGDCNTSFSGNNTKFSREKESREISNTHFACFTDLILLLIHQLSLSCQNWFIRTKVVICEIHMHSSTHETGNQFFLINSEVTQSMAISLAAIIAVCMISAFLVGSNSSQSLLPLLLPEMAHR